MTQTTRSLHNMPPEILWHILSFLTIRDLAATRLVSRKLRTFCDHPRHWRHLDLEPTPASQMGGRPSKEPSMALWQLSDLQGLIGPHMKHVRSIRLFGVRDHIVRFVLANGQNLEKVTFCGWTTLSDHAFKHTIGCTRLRRLELVARAPSNYTAIDATTLGRLLAACPLMTDLLLGCHVHIHAKTFSQSITSAHLRTLTLATHRTWSPEHIATLMVQCPMLEQVSLVPSAATGVDLKKTNIKHWMESKLKQALSEDAFDEGLIHRQRSVPVE